MNNIAIFDFDAEMQESVIPMGEGVSGSASSKQVIPVSFGEGYVPIPVDILKSACQVSRSLSFGDLYSSLVCIEHKSDVTSVFVSTGQAFFASKDRYTDSVEDFRVYIQVQALLKAMALSGSHIGFSQHNISMGFWDLFVPINAVTDSEDLRKHFAQAEVQRDLSFIDIDFPFNALPANILGLYSASIITLQSEGIVWFSSEHKHFVSASFPYNIALHLTTAQVLRTQQFKKIFLEGDKLYLKTDTFLLCVPTFKIEADLFKTTFSVPVVGSFSPVASVQLSTMMKSADLFSGSVKFKIFSNGEKASISALADDKVLFAVPLFLGDTAVHFDYTITADSVFDISAISSLGQNFLSSPSGVCIFFK